MTEAGGLEGGWGSVQAMGLEAALLLGLGSPVEAVRPFLCSLGGGGNITAVFVVVKVHEVGVRVLNSFFISIFKLFIFINVFHLFFTDFVEESGDKGGVDHFNTFNGAIRGVKTEVGVGAAGAGHRGRGARVLLGKEDFFLSMGHVVQFGGHSVMEARQSKRGCGVGEH